MVYPTEQVQVWAEARCIPTYGIGRPDPNPMFLEKRVYQGSSGAVYPYPVIDRVFDQPTNQYYTALFLENRYLRIMILPELGGRVQMALDKTNNYHFIYYNRVIKPALVGLTGPWISGGIEFNWPQHHRPSTFAPLDWRIERHADGSATVWCSEIERMSSTKGMHGFTLYPDRAYLEIKVQLFNRTSEPQTFLWWANPAVHVNETTQSVFPPDVHAVMDHGKRAVSSFPIATGTYYKVDYSPGTDISRYINIPAPTSYMAYHSDFDFIGNYDHGRQAGMLHVANHRIVPGKKQWTWGTSDFGQAWDRQLTDEDGPYIELMCGAFTDNQPDFSWLMPGEEKRFRQIFMPYKQIGPASNASEDAVLALNCTSDSAEVGVYVTRPRLVCAELLRDAETVWQWHGMLTPEEALRQQVSLSEPTRPQQLTLRVYDAESNTQLLSFTPLPDERPPIPEPAQPAPPPSEVATNEELWLHGLHLEQYRHATFAPEPYYQEALRRDPLDSRCNNAMGLLLYRRGAFREAETFFRTAITSLTRRNSNPYDGEPFYNLGLALKMQGRFDEAFDAFYKATWNAAWQDSAFFELARIASRRGNYTEALDLLASALRRNWSHHQARHLQIALLRRLGRDHAARSTIEQALALDVLDAGVLWEQFLLETNLPLQLQPAPSTLRNAFEIALDYLHAGLFADAMQLLQQIEQSDPLMVYLLGYCAQCAGEPSEAQMWFARAQSLPPDYCFPQRLESVLILEAALAANPNDARAAYYLGTFWYAHRRYEQAIDCWERARELDPQFPTVHRNLGLAYFNKRNEPERAEESYERAFALNPNDARVLYELDQLRKRRNHTPQQRLEWLNQHRALVKQRDDLMIEYITILNMLGQHQQALDLLRGRQFHPWEGGEGKVTGQYIASLIGLGRELLAAGETEQAIALLKQGLHYPRNLGEGRLPNARDNHLLYHLGLAYEQHGDLERAREWFERAAVGSDELTSVMYYNDQPPDMLFYQGLARIRLGRADEAQQLFQSLIAHGRQHLADIVTIDYFAVSLPTFLVFDEDLTLRNRIHCLYLIGLGLLGLGQQAEAIEQFQAILALDANHQGSYVHRQFQLDSREQRVS